MLAEEVDFVVTLMRMASMLAVVALAVPLKLLVVTLTVDNLVPLEMMALTLVVVDPTVLLELLALI